MEDVGEVVVGLDVDPLRDTEPVEFLENRGDVVTGAGVGEQTSSGALDVLEFI